MIVSTTFTILLRRNTFSRHKRTIDILVFAHSRDMFIENLINFLLISKNLNARSIQIDKDKIYLIICYSRQDARNVTFQQYLIVKEEDTRSTFTNQSTRYQILT